MIFNIYCTVLCRCPWFTAATFARPQFVAAVLLAANTNAGCTIRLLKYFSMIH